MDYRLLVVFFFCILVLAGLQAQEVSVTSDLSKDTITAGRLLSEQEQLKKDGQYNKAVTRLEQALQLYQKHQLWEAATSCAVRLAKIADNFETTALKEKYAKLSFDLARIHLSEDHIIRASAFRQKAELLMMQGGLDSANYYLNLIVPTFAANERWSDLCWAEILLSVNHLNVANLDSCEVHLSAVKKTLASQTMPQEDYENIEATLLSIYGVFYELRGDYDGAISNTRKALQNDLNASQLTALDSSYISVHYNNLGAFYLIKGDYQRALDNFTQAYSYKSASSQSSLLINIGELYTRQQKIPEAIGYFRNALNVGTNEQNRQKSNFQAYKGLSDCYSELGVFDSTFYYYQKAINVPANFRRYEAHLIAGQASLKKGEVQQSIEYLMTALEDYNSNINKDRGNVFFNAQIYQALGDAYLDNNDVDQALKHYQQSLIVNHANFRDSLDIEKNPSLQGAYEPIYFLLTLWGKARAFSKAKSANNHLQKSLETYQLTIQWIDSLQHSYATDRAQLDWGDEFKQIYEQAIEVAYQNYQHTKDQKYLELAFDFSERSKNRLLLESLKSAEGKSLANVPDSLIQKEKDLNLNIAFYENAIQKAQAEKSEAKTKLYQQYLAQSRLALIALKEQILQSFPKYQDWKYGGKSITVSQTQQQLLDQNSAMIEYFVGKDHVYAFVISPSSFQLIPLDSPQKITQAMLDFRAVLLDLELFNKDAKQAIALYNQKAHALYQQLLQVPLQVIDPASRHLIIVPDGHLSSIPIEALTQTAISEEGIDFSKLSYLIYQYQIHYAYSANLLSKNQIRQQQLPANTNCLAMAPPYRDYPEQNNARALTLRSNSNFLEGTALEIQQISTFYKGQFDADITASEEKFKQLAQQYGLLHLATHGFADFENSNFSYLKFVDTPEAVKGTEDNLLHHYEISTMDLSAQLVVLSACETGVGKYENGEGVFSLARSFMYAGVPSVVMSLWKVSDQSTSQLMPYFYKNLSKGQSKDMALQEAKLQFLEEANLEFRHPFYWSAFVVLGDAQSIKTSPSFLWWGLGTLLFFSLIFFFIKKSRS